MSDAEVSAIDWRECSFNVLLRISSIYVNSGTFGPVATPEAIVVKREDIFPEALDDEDPLGAAPSWWEPPPNGLRGEN